MVEIEKMVPDPDTGRKVKTKTMEYEYEPEMETSYRESLTKSFKKQVDDGFYPFIIIDCINDKIKHFSDIAAYAKKKDYEVYIGEMDYEINTCYQRNIHNRSKIDIRKIISCWEMASPRYNRVNM